MTSYIPSDSENPWINFDDQKKKNLTREWDNCLNNTTFPWENASHKPSEQLRGGKNESSNSREVCPAEASVLFAPLCVSITHCAPGFVPK